MPCTLAEYMREKGLEEVEVLFPGHFAMTVREATVIPFPARAITSETPEPK